ncbi:MAG: FUSC family protein [Hyphomicrobiales bacterium]
MSEARPSRFNRLLDRLDAVVPQPQAWFFALRIWIAMMLALYVAFWLQLESASSAAVSVAILAQPKRGQAISKAIYRFLGTILGGVISIVFAAAFGQDRVLMLVCFTAWLSLCVFVAQYLQDTRAYGAMLSGYTVAIIAISNIDTPQNVFDAAVSRVAAIAVAITAITFINDALASPSTWRGLLPPIATALRSAKVFARQALRDGDPGPEKALDLIRMTAPLRADASAIAGELDDGPQRAAGARSAIAALYATMAASRNFAIAARDAGPDRPAIAEARSICARLVADDGASVDNSTFAEARGRLRALIEAAVRDGRRSLDEVLTLQRARDLATALMFAQDGLNALRNGHRPLRDVRLPTHRDFPVAFRGAARVALAFALTAALFVGLGWPATTYALVQVAAMGAMSSVNPDPLKYANGVVIGIPLAGLAAGLILLLTLPTVNGFPILALAVAPVVFAACFLILNPPTASIGFILLVYFPVLLSPGNPQSFDAQTFFGNFAQMMIVAVILATTVRVILPIRPDQARAYAFDSAIRDVRSALVGAGGDAVDRTSLNSDRIFQYAQINAGPDIVRARRLKLAFAIAHLEASAARAHDQLRAFHRDAVLQTASAQARAALAGGTVGDIEAAAQALLRAGRDADASQSLPVARAVSDLVAVARVMARHKRFLQTIAHPET